MARVHGQRDRCNPRTLGNIALEGGPGCGRGGGGERQCGGGAGQCGVLTYVEARGLDGRHGLLRHAHRCVLLAYVLTLCMCVCVCAVPQATESNHSPSLLFPLLHTHIHTHTRAYSHTYTYTNLYTGFKWLGNKTSELRARGTPVIFSYEEALGFCAGSLVCDKDGVSAAAVLVELASHLAAQDPPTTLHAHLQSLYSHYGEFVSYNSYLFCYDPVTTDKIFARLREGGPGGGYWKECAGFPIVGIKDVTRGYDSTVEGGQSDLPMTPESHMIMFEFANGVTATLRTSGTEPKIKFYTEIAGRPGQLRGDLAATLRTFVDALVEEMLEPDVNALTRP